MTMSSSGLSGSRSVMASAGCPSAGQRASQRPPGAVIPAWAVRLCWAAQE